MTSFQKPETYNMMIKIIEFLTKKNIDVKIRSKLWAVRHEWPSGEKFTFNCYRHWDTLVVRDTEDRSGHFLHIK